MSFIVSDLTFRSLIHSEFIFVHGVKKCSNFSFICSSLVFPAPLIEKAVFSPLYILVSFVKNKVPTGAWVYLWALYLVPLVYISVFVPVLYCLHVYSFFVYSEVRNVDSSRSIFCKTALAIRGLLCFHMNCERFCSSSVKKAIGTLIGIALNL